MLRNIGHNKMDKGKEEVDSVGCSEEGMSHVLAPTPPPDEASHCGLLKSGIVVSPGLEVSEFQDRFDEHTKRENNASSSIPGMLGSYYQLFIVMWLSIIALEKQLSFRIISEASGLGALDDVAMIVDPKGEEEGLLLLIQAKHQAKGSKRKTYGKRFFGLTKEGEENLIKYYKSYLKGKRLIKGGGGSNSNSRGYKIMALFFTNSKPFYGVGKCAKKQDIPNYSYSLVVDALSGVGSNSDCYIFDENAVLVKGSSNSKSEEISDHEQLYQFINKFYLCYQKPSQGVFELRIKEKIREDYGINDDALYNYIYARFNKWYSDTSSASLGSGEIYKWLISSAVQLESNLLVGHMIIGASRFRHHKWVYECSYCEDFLSILKDSFKENEEGVTALEVKEGVPLMEIVAFHFNRELKMGEWGFIDKEFHQYDVLLKAIASNNPSMKVILISDLDDVLENAKRQCPDFCFSIFLQKKIKILLVDSSEKIFIIERESLSPNDVNEIYMQNELSDEFVEKITKKTLSRVFPVGDGFVSFAAALENQTCGVYKAMKRPGFLSEMINNSTPDFISYSPALAPQKLKSQSRLYSVHDLISNGVRFYGSFKVQQMEGLIHCNEELRSKGEFREHLGFCYFSYSSINSANPDFRQMIRLSLDNHTENLKESKLNDLSKMSKQIKGVFSRVFSIGGSPLRDSASECMPEYLKMMVANKVSFVLCGQSGVGKSVRLREWYRELLMDPGVKSTIILERMRELSKKDIEKGIDSYFRAVLEREAFSGYHRFIVKNDMRIIDKDDKSDGVNESSPVGEKNIVLLLDGFDEVHYRNTPKVVNFISSMINAGVTVIVSSRPSALSQLDSCFSIFIDISLLAESDASKFIYTRLEYVTSATDEPYKFYEPNKPYDPIIMKYVNKLKEVNDQLDSSSYDYRVRPLRSSSKIESLTRKTDYSAKIQNPVKLPTFTFGLFRVPALANIIVDLCSSYLLDYKNRIASHKDSSRVCPIEPQLPWQDLASEYQVYETLIVSKVIRSLKKRDQGVLTHADLESSALLPEHFSLLKSLSMIAFVNSFQEDSCLSVGGGAQGGDYYQGLHSEPYVSKSIAGLIEINHFSQSKFEGEFTHKSLEEFLSAWYILLGLRDSRVGSRQYQSAVHVYRKFHHSSMFSEIFSVLNWMIADNAGSGVFGFVPSMYSDLSVCLDAYCVGTNLSGATSLGALDPVVKSSFNYRSRTGNGVESGLKTLKSINISGRPGNVSDCLSCISGFQLSRGFDIKIFDELSRIVCETLRYLSANQKGVKSNYRDISFPVFSAFISGSFYFIKEKGLDVFTEKLKAFGLNYDFDRSSEIPEMNFSISIEVRSSVKNDYFIMMRNTIVFLHWYLRDEFSNNLNALRDTFLRLIGSFPDCSVGLRRQLICLAFLDLFISKEDIEIFSSESLLNLLRPLSGLLAYPPCKRLFLQVLDLNKPDANDLVDAFSNTKILTIGSFGRDQFYASVKDLLNSESLFIIFCSRRFSFLSNLDICLYDSDHESLGASDLIKKFNLVYGLSCSDSPNISEALSLINTIISSGYPLRGRSAFILINYFSIRDSSSFEVFRSLAALSKFEIVCSSLTSARYFLSVLLFVLIKVPSCMYTNLSSSGSPSRLFSIEYSSLKNLVSILYNIIYNYPLLYCGIFDVIALVCRISNSDLGIDGGRLYVTHTSLSEEHFETESMDYWFLERAAQRFAYIRSILSEDDLTWFLSGEWLAHEADEFAWLHDNQLPCVPSYEHKDEDIPFSYLNSGPAIYSTSTQTLNCADVYASEGKEVCTPMSIIHHEPQFLYSPVVSKRTRTVGVGVNPLLIDSEATTYILDSLREINFCSIL